jgi:PAS domain S-box-containing protein
MNLVQKVIDTLSNGKEDNSKNVPLAAEVKKLITDNKFSLLLNSIPSIITYVDKDHCLQYVNAAFEKMFNRTYNEVTGKPLVDFLGKTAYESIRPYMEEALMGNEVHYEMEVPLKDGTRFIEANYTPDFDEKGQVKGYIGLINDITKKKKTEKELANKQRELEDYVDKANVALHWVDASGIIIWANKAELEMLGYSKEEYIGHHISEFHADKDKIDDILTRLTNDEILHQYEARLKHKDGSISTVLINSSVLREEGKFLHTRCFTTNINDRKQMEETLRESKVRYKALMENLPAALYTCDAGGRITLYNQAAAELWGREPVLGKDMWCGSLKIFYPDGMTPMPLETCPMAITLKEGRAVKGKEIVIERPDGQQVFVQAYPVPLFDEAGNITGAVNMLMDISERKLAEKKLAHLAAIIHSSSDPVISISLDGIVTSWNDAAEKIFGYSTDEMIGQPLFKIIPEDRLNEELLVFERLKKGEMVKHMETKRLTKDHRLLDISVTISPIKNNEGQIIGASKILRDITAQKIQNEALRESEERLRMASESVKLGTWEYFPATKKMVWSDEARKILGVSNDFTPTKEFVLENMHPDDLEYVFKEVGDVMGPEGQGEFQIKPRMYRATDKQLRWLKVRGKIYFNSLGEAERFMGNMLDITEEKQAEQAIRESEERLRMAVQSTRLGTWEYFPMAGKLSWSDECKKIYDAPPDLEVDYNFFSKHIHPDDVALAQEAITNAMDPDGSGNYDIQYRILRYSDQLPRWIRAQGKVYFNLNRQPERFIGTVLDITEEKTQEQELKNSVKLFTEMADNVPAMIWMSGDDKFDDFFNKTWLEYTGRTIEQERNEGWLDNVHPDDVEKCLKDYQLSLKEKKGFYTEYRLRRWDGRYRWIADNSVPRYNQDGVFAGFISACMDIDDQKNFREKILESELRLKTISNASPVGLWMTDTNAQNTFVNDTWIKWTGIPFEKQLGTGWMDRVVEEDKKTAPSKFWECLLKREMYSTEFRIVRPDGQLRWCLTEGAPYYDIDGEFAGYAGSVTDITDIRKMEERKDDFIKMASHELKTPITSIKGYVQLLLNIYNDHNEEKFQESKPIVKTSLNTISKQVSKLTRLVSELLDLSRIESGKLELNTTSFELGELVQESVQDALYTSNKHKITVHNNFNGNIVADRDRISQVLLNLLTNAIKYSPHESKIDVSIEGNGKNVSIKVKDRGIGINKKDQEMIFQRFYRVEGKSEQTYPGFGIGLFIATEIIQRHNGSISVESNMDEGAIFTVILPIGRENESNN